ncbi:Peptidoglycan/xylan/chitin deacetylase, PgdA/CDA1 family [Arboricoccus pini]|uniref:Chitooligosaccharide deacetylase n=1 Tax=Arboricoccus pini TaxID=1963835 RepID=A0A212RKS5_9PROT|nr:allantoinase PuuE [Arboricoccus pini]SNB73084.1 Peptidoglycan/xylan/chitin deacetylase, PgdA/CDA1 family [Arboricoccus pini]
MPPSPHLRPERNLVGYGRQTPTGAWPNGARLAINVVVNYEEGSERSFAMGDADQEPMTEWGSYAFPKDIRNLAMESMYEYGSRVGVWRILDSLADARIPATFFACAVAFEQNPAVAQEVVAAGHEVCSHGYRWEEVFRLSEEEEREHIRLAVSSFEKTCGKRPVGWYCRYGPSIRTRRLVTEEGGFLYDSDAYNDDVPYFVTVDGVRRLVVPYTCDVNDIRFWNSPGLSQADDFFRYMRETFDVLYAEAARGPRMMSIGLHPRMIGRPGRIGALKRFFDYARGFGNVWFATREDIARSWLAREDDND